MPLPFSKIANRRSLLGVRNFGSAVAKVLAKQAQGYRFFLVSDGKPVSTPELIQEIGIALNRPARMFALPMGFLRVSAILTGMTDEFDRLTGSLVLDDSAFRREFDWLPPSSMKAGLSEMADSFLGGDVRRRNR